MEPLRLTIEAIPTTKKTHNRVIFIGERCFRCRRGAVPIVLPSEQYEDFERAVAPPLQRWWAEREPRREKCPRCGGTGIRSGKKCVGCRGGQRAVPAFASPVLVEAVFYREKNLGDLAGFITSLADVLEAAGIVENDRLIVGWPMPRDGDEPMRKDAERPRLELWIIPWTPPPRPPDSPQEVLPGLL